MLTAMRQMGLDFLASELGAKGDLEQWYQDIRANAPEKILYWLVEAPDGERFYSLSADPKDDDIAVLEVRDLKKSDFTKLPFNQGTGARSAALGPIVKRTFSAKKIGPTSSTQKTSLKSFKKIAESGAPFSPYFDEAHDCFSRSKLKNSMTDEVIESESNAFAEAIRLLPEKDTVLLCFQDSENRLPGEVPQYNQYLQQILAQSKYATLDAVSVQDKICTMCGADETEVFPNAIKGAGINFANVDREGSFAYMEIDNAWKHFSMCSACADLIYVFAFHHSDNFLARVAGEKALILPSLTTNAADRIAFFKRFKKWIAAIQQKEDATVESRERVLLKVLVEDPDVVELTFLWADFGQRIDNVRRVLSEVLPSRLREIANQNLAFEKVAHPAFPENPLDDFRINLMLDFLLELFKRPGGKKAKKENESKRLFDLRTSVVEAIYLGRNIEQTRTKARFNDELLKTARWHLLDMLDNGHWGDLIYEGWSKKKNVAYLTFAGWIRHLAKILHYLRTIGVLPMPVAEEIYQPELESLKPYFTQETAIDSEPKAFAFLLGVLYGKVMSVQAARGVNVGANALTWLKRLTLSGKDLPELYVKVREKLLAYETEKSTPVREVVEELGRLGSHVNDLDKLGETDTCYFLLLGQSLANTILPSKSKNNEGNE